MKFIAIGDSRVGKSSIIARYVDGNYYHNLPSTIGIDYRVKKLLYEEKPLKLHIWDTAGQEKFKSITLNFYKGVDGILLVFDITNENSLSNVPHWIRQIKLYSTENVCLVLVGNKCDILEGRVPNDRIEGICQEYNLLYFESSAKENINIDQAFLALVGECFKREALGLEVKESKTNEVSNSNGNSNDNNGNGLPPVNEKEPKPKKGVRLSKKQEEDDSDVSKKCC